MRLLKYPVRPHYHSKTPKLTTLQGKNKKNPKLILNKQSFEPPICKGLTAISINFFPIISRPSSERL